MLTLRMLNSGIFLKATWQLYTQSVFLLIEQKHSACGILSCGRWVAVCQLCTSDKLGWSLRSDSAAPLERLPYLRTFPRRFVRPLGHRVVLSCVTCVLSNAELHFRCADVTAGVDCVGPRLLQGRAGERAALRNPASPVIDCSTWRGRFWGRGGKGRVSLPPAHPQKS